MINLTTGIFGLTLILLYFFRNKLLTMLAMKIDSIILKIKLSRRPFRIIFVRHGESVANIDPTIYNTTPEYNIGLTEKGKEQAKAAGQKIKQVIGDEEIKFHVSPILRTRQTFEGISSNFSPKQYSSVQDVLIREQEHGNYLKGEFAEKIEKMKDVGTFFYRFDNGESSCDVYDRAILFLFLLFRDAEKYGCEKNVIVVTHGMYIKVMLMRYFNWTIEEFEKRGSVSNCQVFVLEKDEKGHYSVVSDDLKYKEKDVKGEL